MRIRWLNDWPNDKLNHDWPYLTDRQTAWLPDWLTNWPTDRLPVWRPTESCPTEWLTDPLTDLLTDRLTDWLTDYLFSLTVTDCSVGFRRGPRHYTASASKTTSRHCSSRHTPFATDTVMSCSDAKMEASTACLTTYLYCHTIFIIISGMGYFITVS